jgi:hypothetical protein
MFSIDFMTRDSRIGRHLSREQVRGKLASPLAVCCITETTSISAPVPQRPNQQILRHHHNGYQRETAKSSNQLSPSKTEVRGLSSRANDTPGQSASLPQLVFLHATVKRIILFLNFTFLDFFHRFITQKFS